MTYLRPDAPTLDFAIPNLGGKPACHDDYPDGGALDAWHPHLGSNAQHAREVCNTRCEVQEACLTWALEHNERDGVWGGKTPVERARIRRNRQRAAERRAAS